jgi:type I restriction enzyme R subunit
MNKKDLSESDLCDKFIRPAVVAAGWSGLDQIYREYPLRAGRVMVRGKKAQRDPSTGAAGRLRTVLQSQHSAGGGRGQGQQHAMGAGMQQALSYADLLGVPFSFSSNGDGFVFRDATWPPARWR